MPAQSSRKRSSPNSTDAQPILQMACLLQCYSVFQVAQYSNCIGTSSGEGSDFSLSTNKLVLPILYNQEGRRRTVSGDRFLDRSGAHLIVNTLQNSHNFKPIDVKWGTLTCPWWEYLFHKNRQKLQTTSPHPHPCYQTLPVWVRVLQRNRARRKRTHRYVVVVVHWLNKSLSCVWLFLCSSDKRAIFVSEQVQWLLSVLWIKDKKERWEGERRVWERKNGGEMQTH